MGLAARRRRPGGDRAPGGRERLGGLRHLRDAAPGRGDRGRGPRPHRAHRRLCARAPRGPLVLQPHPRGQRLRDAPPGARRRLVGRAGPSDPGAGAPPARRAVAHRREPGGRRARVLPPGRAGPQPRRAPHRLGARHPRGRAVHVGRPGRRDGRGRGQGRGGRGLRPRLVGGLALVRLHGPGRGVALVRGVGAPRGDRRPAGPPAAGRTGRRLRPGRRPVGVPRARRHPLGRVDDRGRVAVAARLPHAPAHPTGGGRPRRADRSRVRRGPPARRPHRDQCGGRAGGRAPAPGRGARLVGPRGGAWPFPRRTGRAGPRFPARGRTGPGAHRAPVDVGGAAQCRTR